jgi:hypothetical protein
VPAEERNCETTPVSAAQALAAVLIASVEGAWRERSVGADREKRKDNDVVLHVGEGFLD